MSNKRRIIDCQYFKKDDIAVIHEILNGKRNYIVIKEPDFEYFIEKELKAHKKDTEYYKPISELRSVKCKYSKVQESILENIPVYQNGERVFSPFLIPYSERKAKIMCNHNLYSADDTIENRLIIDYYEKYRSEIDESIPIKFLFFDIETHCDFRYTIYLELEKIYNYLNGKSQNYVAELDDIDLSYYETIMNEEDPEKFKSYIDQYKYESNLNLYADPRLFISLMKSKMSESEEYRNRTLDFVKRNLTKDKLTYFYENLGFPDENKGNNRIDAISFVDTIDRKLYMYLLDVASDLNDKKDLEYIRDVYIVKKDLFKFVELFSVISFLKNIEKSDHDKYLDLLKDLSEMVSIYEKAEFTEDELLKVSDFIELSKTLIENYDNIIKIDVEYKIFKSELEMLTDFFNKIKYEIKPNIIAAHNAKFDINTIKNRLEKYSKKFDNKKLSFEYQINQLTDLGEDFEDLDILIKIDMNVKQQNQEKTKYVFPGLVTLDTLLLYAKLIAKERDYSLNAIALDELSDKKIEYSFDISEFYMRDIKRFIKYSAVDTLLLMRLEEKLKFLELYQLIMSDTKSDWGSYIYTTAYLTNWLKYEFWDNKDCRYVMRNNLTGLNPKRTESDDEVGYDGAYNTYLSGPCDSYGYHENLFDLDYSSFYPSCAITTNICPSQFYFSVDDRYKEMHNDYMFMDRITFANKYFEMPSIKDIMEEL